MAVFPQLTLNFKQKSSLKAKGWTYYEQKATSKRIKGEIADEKCDCRAKGRRGAIHEMRDAMLKSKLNLLLSEDVFCALKRCCTPAMDGIQLYVCMIQCCYDIIIWHLKLSESVHPETSIYRVTVSVKRWDVIVIGMEKIVFIFQIVFDEMVELPLHMYCLFISVTSWQHCLIPPCCFVRSIELGTSSFYDTRSFGRRVSRCYVVFCKFRLQIARKHIDKWQLNEDESGWVALWAVVSSSFFSHFFFSTYTQYALASVFGILFLWSLFRCRLCPVYLFVLYFTHSLTF